jgi:hypothetical protein
MTYGYEDGFQPTGPDDSVYPYPRLDLSKVGPPAPRTYKAIVLQNGYVSLTILPELGGRVYQWIDKATGRHLLYENPVIKPTSWGYRGWWLSAGGIEWAFPVEEHGLNEWQPWNYSISGSSVTVNNVEARTGMEVGATISLDSSHAYMTLQPWAKNNTTEAHPYQFWLNAMLTLGGNNVSGQTQFIVPAGEVTIHSTGDGGVPSGGTMSWPTYGGRDMSWYGNWGGYLGFFSPSREYSGLYDHNADQGMVRVHAPGWPAGTKFFGPAGLSPSLWTDDGSSYVELWSGATGTFWSNNILEPGASVGWLERWYPVSQMGGVSYANESAALRLVGEDERTNISVAVSSITTGEIELWAAGQLVANWSVSLYPAQAFRATWTGSVNEIKTLGLRLTNQNGVVLAQTGQLP